MITPTEEGKRRYPNSGGFNYEVNPAGEPCTCDGCQGRCAGECGCKACTDQFLVFCDIGGFMSARGMDEEAALKSYKKVQSE